MTLKELSKQYYDDAEKLTEQIDTLRKQTKSLKGAKLHTANRHLCCLYEMRRDAKMTAEILEHYYDETPKARLYHRHPGEI